MSLLAAGAAGAYLCSEAFVPGVGVARAQAGWVQGELVVDLKGWEIWNVRIFFMPPWTEVNRQFPENHFLFHRFAAEDWGESPNFSRTYLQHFADRTRTPISVWPESPGKPGTNLSDPQEQQRIRHQHRSGCGRCWRSGRRHWWRCTRTQDCHCGSSANKISITTIIMISMMISWYSNGIIYDYDILLLWLWLWLWLWYDMIWYYMIWYDKIYCIKLYMWYVYIYIIHHEND